MVSKKTFLLLTVFVGFCVFTLVRTAGASGQLVACHFETRDQYYAEKKAFYPGENVYVDGDGFPHGVWVDIHVVNDTTWSKGMNIPSDGIITTVLTSTSGEIPLTMVWNAPLTPGKYDIVVDVNRNCIYDNGDCLEDNEVNVTAGFLVIPEYVIGTALGTAGFFAAFGAYRLFKPKNKVNLPR